MSVFEKTKYITHSKSSRLSAAGPTPCFTSQIGTIRRSHQTQSHGVSSARAHLTTHACIPANIWRGSCVSLSDFDAHLVFRLLRASLFFLSHTIEKHLLLQLYSSTCCPLRLSTCPTTCFTSQIGTMQRSGKKHKSQGVSLLPGTVSQHSSEPMPTIMSLSKFDTQSVPLCAKKHFFSTDIVEFLIAYLSHSNFVSCLSRCLQCCL